MPETLDNSNQQFAQVCAELTALHERKNHDYGDTFGKNFRDLAQHGKVHAMTYLIGHLKEKLARMETLTYDGAMVKEENIIDSMQDLACYDIMGLAILKTIK